jgi:hypothetical protein
MDRLISDDPGRPIDGSAVASRLISMLGTRDSDA